MSDNKPKKLVLENFLPYRLSFLTNIISRKLSSLYSKQFDITPQEWKVLAILSGHPDISAAEAGERAVLDKVTVSRAVSGLKEKGLVDKSFSELDRRRSVLNLTADGKYIYCQIEPRMIDYENFLLSILSREEKSKLDHLLHKLTAHVTDSSPT